MRQIIATLLVVLGSSTTITRPLFTLGRKGLDRGDNATNMVHPIPPTGYSVQIVETHRTSDETRMSLDQLLKLLELAFDEFLAIFGSSLGLTPHQIIQAETDFHSIIVTIEGLEHRNTEAQAGAEQIARGIMQLLIDFGVDPIRPSDDTPTKLDTVLDVLQKLLDEAVEVYGPQFNLDPYIVSEIETDIGQIMTHIKDMEHGRTALTDGLVQLVDDVFNMLRDFGVPVLDTDSTAGLKVKAAALEKQLTTLMAELSRLHSVPYDPAVPSSGRIRQLTDAATNMARRHDKATPTDLTEGVVTVVKLMTHVLANFNRTLYHIQQESSLPQSNSVE